MHSLKHKIRTQAEATRRAKPDKDEASRIICASVAGPCPSTPRPTL